MNASFDGGNTWNGQRDINTSIQWILSECVFPEMAPIVDDIVHVVFQEDNIPGTFEWPGEQAERTENRIYHNSFPVSFFVNVPEPVQEANFTVGQVYPNPANDETKFRIVTKEQTHVAVNITNLMGQFVKSIDIGMLGPGNHPMQINVSDLKAGIYNITVRVNDQRTTQKLLIH
jgi:hypothetical protein